MKQTAVEWYAEQSMLLELKRAKGNISITQMLNELSNILEQAKEMEKQQLVEAHGNKLKKSKDEGNYEYWFSGEDYYNKTFKNTEQ